MSWVDDARRDLEASPRRQQRVAQLRADERTLRALGTWYGTAIAALFRWWRRTILLDPEP